MENRNLCTDCDRGSQQLPFRLRVIKDERIRCAIISRDILLPLLFLLLLPVTGSRLCSVRRIIRIGMHICYMEESPL